MSRCECFAHKIIAFIYLENDKEIELSGENGTEYLTQIWFKEYLETQDLNITFESENIIVAIFIQPGRKIVYVDKIGGNF